jgi:Flp pilus assembly protein TadB
VQRQIHGGEYGEMKSEPNINCIMLLVIMLALGCIFLMIALLGQNYMNAAALAIGCCGLSVWIWRSMAR